MVKNLGSGPILAHLAQIWAANTFFSKIWLLDIMISYHDIQYQKILMIQSWQNVVTDLQMGRLMDRRTRVISWDAVD